MLHHQSNFDYQRSGKMVLCIEREGLDQLDQYINSDFSNACKAIFACRGKVVVMGVGKSGHIGKKIAATFASTGTPAFFVHPSEASHGDLGMVSHNDVVIAISNSGESHEILTLIPILKRHKILLICITSRPESSIGRVADVHLCVKVPKEACPFGITPTSSSAAILVMGDALAVSLLEARGFTREKFIDSHPGGALGRKYLLHVHDIMRKGNKIPKVTRDTLLQDALFEIMCKNLGFTVIINDMMQIEGIFTDGDLRRIFSIDIKWQLIQMKDIMTHGGIRIKQNMLVVEALKVMRQKNIAALLVADDDDHLLGVLHLRDVLRSGVI